MSLRLTGGEARGREIKALHGQATRPTAARAREALFNILRDTVTGKRWLDLFAGTGTIGIEALSRGAAHVSFADTSREACSLIKANVAMLGYGDRSFVWCGDVVKVLARYQAEPFDVAFLDPPWDKVDYRKVLFRLAEGGLIKPGGMIVAEHRKGLDLPHDLLDWQLQRQVAYGDSAFSFYTQPNAAAIPDKD